MSVCHKQIEHAAYVGIVMQLHQEVVVTLRRWHIFGERFDSFDDICAQVDDALRISGYNIRREA